MKKILIIEDNQDLRENTAELLALSHYQVLTAPDGKAGVELAIINKPDLIICDIMMPVLDGYGVLHMLHKNRETQKIPFIFLSAKAERTDIRKGMGIGADDYIAKPFDATDLLHAVESRLKRAEMLKQEVATSPDTDNVESSESKDLMKQFLEGRNLLHFKKKQLIYMEGNHPSALYYVLKGKAKSFKTNDEGKELTIDLYSEGDFIGYTALLDGSTYKESAVAMSDTELEVIPRKDFEELINSHWDIAQRFIKMMARNVAEKEEHLLGLAYNSLRKKVAEALVKLHQKYAQDQKEGVAIDLSREHLASIAGTATESLIRTLGDFRAEHLIDIQEGRIIILNEQKLKRMLN
jgi:CRP/FNR family transcriptional regulator, cyclic AMP receptor protein